MNQIFEVIDILDWNTDVWHLLVRLGLSIIAGFFLGYENKLRSKDAGIKTHTILCMTACLLMIISKYGFYELGHFEGIQYDASRVASTVMSGLCFLGAGMVFYKQDSIKGLTSAVGMCLTIAIGMSFGAGLIVIASSVTLVAITLQTIMHLDLGIFKSSKHIIVKAVFVVEDNYVDHIKEVFGIKSFIKFKVKKDGNREIAEVEFYYDAKVNSEELVEIARKEKQILFLEKY